MEDNKSNTKWAEINLGDVSRVLVLEECRKFSETNDIPVLALSAIATKDNIVTRMKAGFCRYLTKPIPVLEFKDAIHDASETTR